MIILLVRTPRSIQMDGESTLSLLQLMSGEGLIPSDVEELKRKDVIDQLNQMVLIWIKTVAWQRRLPKDQVALAFATILTYGSYGLGVHGSESDIDAVCLGPCFASTKEDFFVVLKNMLETRSEVSNLHCIKNAKVPLIRFNFNGIPVDLSYAQLNVFPENMGMLNSLYMEAIDETSRRSLSGVCANNCILQLVPDIENFRLLLRFVKLWAKRRGVYGSLFCFLGGVHLAILAAFTCQRHPSASLNVLVSSFFEIFALWPWPEPVMLDNGMTTDAGHDADGHCFIPIRLPFTPYEYCHSNITRSTFYKIRAEFLRGHALTKNSMLPGFDWSCIFEPFPYEKRYTRFIRIHISATTYSELEDWVGMLKSRFRNLLLKLEEIQGNSDPNPTEYISIDSVEPNVVFYWGLQPSRICFVDTNFIEAYFMSNVCDGYQGPVGNIELSVVQASELPFQVDQETRKGLQACWKNMECDPEMVPVYSQHCHSYFVGYLARE